MLVSELFNLIGEGIHDRHTYKAVFMAGSPGSGKTTVRKSLFGGTSLKVVDPDEIHRLLQRSVDEEEISFHPRREQARLLRKSFINQGLGIVIDGTHPKIAEVSQDVASLKQLGYDCAMVLVNAPLDTCLDRIKTRAQETGRHVDRDYAENVWTLIQNTIPQYQRLFGNTFWQIDNSQPNYVPGTEQRQILQWLNRS